MSLALIIITIVLLLVVSAFFSGSETALTAASRSTMHRMASDGDERAARVSALMDDRECFIGAILLGNNLVNILASALATGLFIAIAGEEGVFYATLVMTALVLIFAEVMPKTYAIARSDQMALFVTPAIRIVISVFGPVVSLVQRIVRGTLKLFGVDISEGEGVLSASEQIRGAIDLRAHEGGIIKAERDMLGSILDLEDVEVEEVMIHRKNMEMLSIDEDPETLVAQLTRSQYTRLPVWQGNPDNIVGILHNKDVLRALRRTGFDVRRLNLRRVMRQAWFVPETNTLREQLGAFLERRAHFGLVVDEYGALQGLITLEDILEEIVGEIEDEYDSVTEGVRQAEDGTVLADGTVTIRDLNRQFDWQLPDEEAATVAGLLLFVAESIPEVGETYSFGDFRFEVLARRRNQITKVCITPPPTAEEEKG